MITNRYHFEVIDSTNQKAKELAEKGCPQGTLVTADFQEAGRGRIGRSWSSEKGTGIYMSMVLRPEITTSDAPMLTLVAAISVAKAIMVLTEDFGGKPKIKWPNDIVMNKKKICGILTEMSIKATQMDYIIVGIGINVTNQTFAEEIKATASSILMETGKIVDKEMLITEVWKQFKNFYNLFLETKNLQFCKAEYESFLVNKEKKVNVLDPLGEYQGIARGITNTGELMVETADGYKLVSGGEVSVRGIYGYV